MFKVLTIQDRPSRCRNVLYFGIILTVPKTPGTMTTNKNGTVYWNKEPFIPRAFIETWTICHTSFILLGTVNYEGDWKESLKRTEEC